MKNSIFQIIFILFFVCCNRSEHNYYEIKLLNNRVKIEIPNTWHNINPKGFYFSYDTNKEAFYGLNIKENRVSIEHIEKEFKNLDVILEEEIMLLKTLKQPWSKITNSSVNYKNNTISIETKLDKETPVIYTKLYKIILPNERFDFFFVGAETIEFKKTVVYIINSIEILPQSPKSFQ